MWKKVVEDVIKQLNEKFGKESPLSTTRGKVLEYLGMTLDYTTAGKEKNLCTNIYTRCLQNYLLT